MATNSGPETSGHVANAAFNFSRIQESIVGMREMKEKEKLRMPLADADVSPCLHRLEQQPLLSAFAMGLVVVTGGYLSLLNQRSLDKRRRQEDMRRVQEAFNPPDSLFEESQG
eukprot:CAMPEP_0172031410 /NCGR_PEP_ID=MMETSP1041-20130122/19284_1 /TAXON_ID=464988 /ORGANISM="Hemiselmis andersenii, Strain CCMP439" /LENGTH=112 /DNA_ID=CAMNT_0012687907 /DNA_START=20 /DNA_END=359 /DNA_ORIENTATION=+